MINERLISSLFKKDSNIIFVAAYGSYPRDESAYIIDENDQLQLFNDFDLVVVVKDNELFLKKSLDYKAELSKIIGACDIDFLVIDKPISKRLKSTIWFRDFKDSHKIFYGDNSDMNYYFGTSNNYSISVFDVYSFFITRSWAAGALSPALNIEPFNKVYKGYQAAKLIIATVDIFLISYSKYETLLKDKIKALESIDSKFSNKLVEYLMLAIKVKKSPLDDSLSEKIKNEEYRLDLINNYNFVFSDYLKSKFLSSDSIVRLYMKLRYLKCFISEQDKKVKHRLNLRHEIAALLLQFKTDQNIDNLNKQMAIILTNHESL